MIVKKIVIGGREIDLSNAKITSKCDRKVVPRSHTGQRQKRDLKWAVKGMTGAVKALAGRDPASQKERDRRLSICESCEHYTGRKCDLCGCLTSLKIRTAGASCPDDPPRWGAEGTGGPAGAPEGQKQPPRP